MGFSIRADFPLGTYRARRPDQTLERIPSVARLYSALLAAAGNGPRAVLQDDEWLPCSADETALRWLEENPPTELAIPRFQVSVSDGVAYRDDGALSKSPAKNGSPAKKTIRKRPKPLGSVAVSGSFVWAWHETPPEPIAVALGELCGDVPYLGSTESPVILSTRERAAGEPTHALDPNAGRFSPILGQTIDVLEKGRFDVLRAQHRAERSGKVGQDRVKQEERSRSPVPSRRAVRAVRYRLLKHVSRDVPWTRVLVVALDQDIAERDRVRVTVAAHRALIKMLDALDGSVPPVLTGTYPAGVRRPGNHVALQILDKGLPTAWSNEHGSVLAVLLPGGIEPSEADAVFRAVSALRDLRPGGRVGKVTVTGGVEAIVGDEFWSAPRAGMVRRWRVSPPAVPDTRGRSGWTFEHAALLSLGFVWQDTPMIATPKGRGAERDGGFVAAAEAAGARVLKAWPSRVIRVEDYVHRLHRHAVVRPYQVLLSVGDLGGTRTVQAIGQSRHLGGGLLVPEDRFAVEGEPGWIQ